MSYTNHYILSTVLQLQPDGKTVFAYDIKMGDIQDLTTSLMEYDQEQMIIFDSKGTIIGSTNEKYLAKVSLTRQKMLKESWRKPKKHTTGNMSAYLLHLLVIRFPRHDTIPSVDLFQQDNSHQLMRKRHL